MARLPFGRGSRLTGWNPNLIYVIATLLSAAVVGVVLYGLHPFGRNDDANQAPAGIDAPNRTAPVAPRLAAEVKAEPNLTSIAPRVSTESDPKVAELIAEATLLVNTKPDSIIEARDKLNQVLPICKSQQQRAAVKEQLSNLANKWLFSRTIFPQDRLCANYKVKRGEQLTRIGEQFKVPYEILMQINNIHRPEALQGGQAIKVIHGPFHVKIYRSTFTMDLYLQDTFVRSVPVGLGMPDRRTPTGTWRVKPGGKLISPTWTDPDTGRTYRAKDPDYPLGSRWIALEGIDGEAKGRTGFAIHGTKDPEQIGMAGSRGCIRLDNGVAVLVYNLLVPIYSQVTVEE